MAKRELEEEIRDFFDLWKAEEAIDFLNAVIPLFEMFQETGNQCFEPATEEDSQNILMIRYLYVMSKISEQFSGKFAMTRSRHGKLWRRLEERVEADTKLMQANADR